MTPAGIILLVAGIAVFAVSFFIPDKGDREDKNDIARKQEQIRRLMESELDGMKLRVNEATNETVEFGMEKSERALEKITNDKIMAVNEYATAVMEEIDRNHKEVLFLYDMLSDKHTDVKNTVRHAEATVREVNDAAKTAEDTAAYAESVVNAVNVESVMNTKTTNSSYMTAGTDANSTNSDFDLAQNLDAYFNNIEQTEVEPTPIMNISAPTESVFGMAATMDGFSMEEPSIIEPVVKSQQEEIAEESKEDSEFAELERTTKFKNVSNNNQMILKLNAEGVPVVDIARQLSLGVGEVQLVIDLFK